MLDMIYFSQKQFGPYPRKHKNEAVEWIDVNPRVQIISNLLVTEKVKG